MINLENYYKKRISNLKKENVEIETKIKSLLQPEEECFKDIIIKSDNLDDLCSQKIINNFDRDRLKVISGLNIKKQTNMQNICVLRFQMKELELEIKKNKPEVVSLETQIDVLYQALHLAYDYPIFDEFVEVIREKIEDSEKRIEVITGENQE